MLAAGGFLPGEAMTFEIDIPKHSQFVGPSQSSGERWPDYRHGYPPGSMTVLLNTPERG